MTLSNIQAEQALLGAAMVENAVVDRVSIRWEDFHDPVHGAIWREIVERVTNGQLATPTLLRPKFDGDAGLNMLGGAAYLVRLMGAAVSPGDAPAYARQIAGLARRREILTSLEAAQAAVRGEGDPDTIAATLEAEMMLIHDRARPEARAESLLSATHRALEKMSDAYQAGRSTGMSTGIDEIDRMTGGMLAPEVWTLAGRSSMGKTAVALHIALTAAQAGVPVFFASLEMDAADLSQRLLSALWRGKDGAAPYTLLRTPHKLSEAQMRGAVDAGRIAGRLPLSITPPSLRSLGGIRAEARAVSRRFKAKGLRLGLIVVDYIQRVDAPGESQQERISNAMAGMKDLAVTHECPVLSLAQLNRDVERRAGAGVDAIPRPRLSDLQGSGSLEQDSDVVLLAHRDEYYLDRMRPPPEEANRAKFYATKAKAKGKLEIQIAKFRNGEVGEVLVDADLAHNAILNPERVEGFI